MTKILRMIACVCLMLFLAAAAMAGEIATRTTNLTAVAANGGGTVTWSNSTDWASAEVLYVQAYNMLGGSASTLTVKRVSNTYTETLGTISGHVTTSNGLLVVRTTNAGVDLVPGDKIQIDALATNVTFSANITYKLHRP